MKRHRPGRPRPARPASGRTALLPALALLVCLAACAAAPQPAPVPGSTPPQPAESAPAASAPAERPVHGQAFLTGAAKGAGYPEGRRITAVMVNNIAVSRPTRGVSEAKVVVEIPVEYPITRLMCLYEDYETMPEVGGVRSGRDQFLQLLLPFRGFYVHEGPVRGAPHPVNQMLDIWDYDSFDLQSDVGAGYRVPRPGLDFEHTLYTSGAHIAAAAESKGAADDQYYGSPIFNFQTPDQPSYVPAGGQADEIAVMFNPSYRTLLSYSGESGRYSLSMFSEYSGMVEPYIDDASGVQAAFDNVVVIFAPMERHADSDLMRVDYSQGGGGYVFTRGGYEGIIWRKGAEDQPLALKKLENEDDYVPLNVGTTYLAVVSDAQAFEFDEVLAAGAAGEAVGAGEVNMDRVDTEEPAGPGGEAFQ